MKACTAGKTLPLLLILVGGTVVRLMLWNHFGSVIMLHDDERDYNALAVNLVQHGEFAFTPGRPLSDRPPLYPLLLAGVYRVFGVENFQAVRFFQAALSLLNVLVMYRLGSALYSRRVGLWTAALFCFYPSLLGFNDLLMTEVLFIFLLSLACYLLVLALQRDSFRDLVMAGAVLGFATLTRSVLWLFPLPTGVLLLFIWRGTLMRRVLAAATFVAVFAAVLTPWAIRNTRLHQTFIAVDTMGGRNFLMGNYKFTPLYRAWDAISLTGEQSWYFDLVKDHSQTERRTQGLVDKLALREGLRFVLNNPALTAKRDAIKFYRFWGLERELIAQTASGYYGHFSSFSILTLTAIIFASYAVTIIAAIFGLLMTPSRDKRSLCCLLLVVGFVWGIHTIVFSHSRYHLPVLVLLFPFAASALTNLKNLLQRRRERAFAIAVGVTSLLMLSWMWEIFVIDGDRFLRYLQMT